MSKTEDKKVEEVKKDIEPVIVEAKKEEDLLEKVRKEFRRPDLENRGRLHIDAELKKPGKVLRVVSCKPGRVKYLESLGYRVVQNEGMKVGSGSLSENSGLGSAVTLDAGINHSTPSVVMEIDEDLYKARQKVKTEMNDEQLQAEIAANQGHK
jgi:hypothetical protein